MGSKVRPCDERKPQLHYLNNSLVWSEFLHLGMSLGFPNYSMGLKKTSIVLVRVK